MVEADLIAISHLVGEKFGWGEDKREATLAEYQAMLREIAGDEHARATPPKDVDRLWHFHIIHTTKYADYCERNFGKFVHHIVYFSEDEVERLTRLVGAKVDFSGARNGKDTSLTKD